jgi:hypothetical protein
MQYSASKELSWVEGRERERDILGGGRERKTFCFRLSGSRAK